MPLYDFRCSSCNNIFELQLTLAEHGGESSKKKCPQCSSTSIEQVMSSSCGLLLGGTIRLSDIPPGAKAVGYPGYSDGGDSED